MRVVIPLLVLALLTPFSLACRTAKGGSLSEKRSFASKMKQEALNDLYAQEPGARSHLQNAEGYAVFSSVGSKILVLATGSGFGVATDNRSGKNTFMRMVEAGGGVGIGIKDYRAIYVFDSREAFDSFLDGSWQAAGDADIGAKSGEKGGSAGVGLSSDELSRPVTVYQFTEKGVSLAAVATGTRFYPDEDLN